MGGRAEDARKAFTKGPVGVMSRSGGMTTEMCNTLTAAGLGQSTAVSIGGDAIIGSTYADLMPLFEADPETKAIVIYCEPGGRMEAELANYVVEKKSRLPIVAFMAGRFMDEMPGMRFGHAGTIVEGKADTTADKIARLQRAGISVAERIEDIPGAGQATPGEWRRKRRQTWHFSSKSKSIPAAAKDAAVVKKLVEVCPVNIFAQKGDGAARSSRRTSTSARSASCAWTPPRRARCG